MRVLVGCEESGKVRDAFIKRGHDAWSCDLVKSRSPGPHLQMDIIRAIRDLGPWDIIILFPDCTAMTLSGNRTYAKGKKKYRERLKAIRWTGRLWFVARTSARIGCALENPTSVLWKANGWKPQYIQPYEFGHGETKKTGILVDRLPALEATNHVAGRKQRVWKMGPSPTRKRDRSETYDGIASAMGEQWGRVGYGGQNV
jgi:hypothetical protein